MLTVQKREQKDNGFFRHEKRWVYIKMSGRVWVEAMKWECVVVLGQSVGWMMWLLSCQSNNGQVTLHLSNIHMRTHTNYMSSQTYTLQSNTHTKREKVMLEDSSVSSSLSHASHCDPCNYLLFWKGRQTHGAGKKQWDRCATGGHSNNKFVSALLCMCTLSVC